MEVEGLGSEGWGLRGGGRPKPLLALVSGKGLTAGPLSLQIGCCW